MPSHMERRLGANNAELKHPAVSGQIDPRNRAERRLGANKAELKDQAVTAADLLTVRQAAEYAPAFGERYLRRLIMEQRIPVVRIGRRVFLARADLDRLAADGYTQAV